MSLADHLPRALDESRHVGAVDVNVEGRLLKRGRSLVLGEIAIDATDSDQPIAHATSADASLGSGRRTRAATRKQGGNAHAAVDQQSAAERDIFAGLEATAARLPESRDRAQATTTR